ncbi:hypothetical protein N0V93_002636 [Gnomoniopsis smithogilvyi]|uniref:DUF6536 domain-containing protein n=1 Tax=Gnomoniopsis smithogilvyi TaxID=1191159 RepID=A0A9W8YWZ0_9PEZI|nr:hypothetical protein N0V93_002636 [Gnomoniopsis smithogilvyi]
MFILDALATHGWRRTGAVNVLIIFSCWILLFVCLLVNVFLSPSRSVSEGRIVFDGDCGQANRLGLLLHLMINIFSTGLLASSNFFMQVLSAPSRGEIDRAHRSLLALEIGVPSIKNFIFLSPFKKAVWIGLFLSSVPIHLLFNSAVYETNFDGSNWNLTIATEAFVTGEAQYFGPGASLANSGSALPSFAEQYFSGYGNYIPLSDYWDDSSPGAINRSITSTASDAESWTNLTIEECYSEYRFCQPKKRYRDVVVVVASEDPGWKRADMFAFNETNTELTDMWNTWDANIPPNTTNSLWFSAQCINSRYADSVNSDQCDANVGQCAGALGDPDATAWTNTSSLPGSSWAIPFNDAWMRLSTIYGPDVNFPEYGYNESFNNLNVAYCLAEPAPVYKCKVGVSNALLLVVVLCTLTKVALGTLVVLKLPDSSLVTLGDALESFISRPDPRTAGLGTFNNVDGHRIEREKRQVWDVDGLLKGPRPRKWHFNSRRFKTVITKEVWLRTYSILSAGVALLAVALAIFTSAYGGDSLTGSFGSSDNNISVDIFLSPPSYTVMLLAANSPQIILSFCYFSFNAFFTRTQNESEWSSYSLVYKPLRVSVPAKGSSQTSTYRLQLPYRYSLPLLGMSIMLHWILSNAIFFYVVEGGFWTSSTQTIDFSPSDLGVSEDAYMALGVSGKALLTMLIVSTVLCFLPIIFSHRKVPGSIVSGGSSSLVLSSACHTSVMARDGIIKDFGSPPNAKADRARKTEAQETHNYQDQPTFGLSLPGINMSRPSSYDRLSVQEEAAAEPVMGRDSQERDEKKQLLSFETLEEQEEYEAFLLRKVTFGKVKWGAMAIDPDLFKSLNVDGIDGPVKHLGFGSEEDHVETPQEGHFYI